jgi:hypothetical protein
VVGVCACVCFIFILLFSSHLRCLFFYYRLLILALRRRPLFPRTHTHRERGLRAIRQRKAKEHSDDARKESRDSCAGRQLRAATFLSFFSSAKLSSSREKTHHLAHLFFFSMCVCVLCKCALLAKELGHPVSEGGA